jgi:hypothetical protein
MLTNKYLTRPEAAEHLTARGLRITKGTLQKMATVGNGPPYRKFGYRAVYLPDELENWAQKKLGKVRGSTSEK